jgi:hypothetical protein
MSRTTSAFSRSLRLPNKALSGPAACSVSSSIEALSTVPARKNWVPMTTLRRCVAALPALLGGVAATGTGGAAATLAAAAGVGSSLLAYTVHPEASGRGLELPGSQVPVLPPETLDLAPPDLLLVLDGSSASTVRGTLARHCCWEGRIALPLPGLQIV